MGDAPEEEETPAAHQTTALSADADGTKGSKRGDEACEHLQRDMTSEHVCEKTNRQ